MLTYIVKKIVLFDLGEMNLRVIENSTKKFKFMTYNGT